ncbi:MAG: hypothetical protein ACLQAT_10020 [Candidatus Binataceae bacterium]
MADSQIVEIVGRNWLVSELYRAGVEVARPERDHGIDLIAFVDLDESRRFVSRPIQMKASSRQMFGVWRKHEKFPDLLLAYVWNLSDASQTECYCLSFSEAQRVAEQMGWTKTDSWIKGEGYSTSAPGKRLLSLLEGYQMTPDLWRAKIRTSSGVER